MNNNQKIIQTKLTKGVLDIIIFQYLDQESMHGYQLITKIRKDYGIYFGPSTVYPLLGNLEKKGLLKSTWHMNSERPKKIYELTEDGKNALSYTSESLSLICRNMVTIDKNHLQSNMAIEAKSKIHKENIAFTIR